MCNKIVTVLILGVIGFYISCSTTVSGTGTETSTKVIGMVVDSINRPAPNLEVRIIPNNYNPLSDQQKDMILFDTTDTTGMYTFDILRNGIYNIKAIHSVQRSGLLIMDISAFGDTIVIPTDTLKGLGTIKVILPDTIDTTNGYVFIEGTDIYQKINAKTVYLDAVPAGVTPKIKYTNISISEILVDSMTVIPNDTVIQASVLLITKFRNSGLDTISLFIAEKLKEIGLSVKMVDDSTVSLADTAGMSAVIFSPTAYARPRLEPIFKEMPLPLLNMEVAILKHFGMTDTVQGVDYGRLSGIVCEIYDSPHSIAGGLSGIITIYSDSGDIEWGKPGTGAQKISVLPGTIDSAAIFCYEKDAEMVDMKAPAKLGAFLLQGKGVYILTNDGWYLFRNMVKWLFE